MKKSLLSLLFAAFSLTTFAGRQTDIEFQLLSPQNNTTILPGGTFLIQLQARNTGGDDLQSNDTILVKLTIDGSAFPFVNPSGGAKDTFLRFANFSIAPGGSAIVFTQNFGFSDSGNHTICLEGFLKSAAINPSINDPNSANNIACSQIKFTTAGIATLNPQERVFKVHPLPAGNTLNWNSSVSFQPVTTALYNLTGTCVQRNQIAAGQTGISLLNLPAGMYLLQATDKNGVVESRSVVKE